MPESKPVNLTTSAPTLAQKSELDESKVKAHFDKIAENVNKQQGKIGFNPFVWLKETVNPLIERFKKGERSSKLEGEILSLPEVPPLPNEGKGVEYDPAPTQQDISQAPPQAPGMKLKNHLLD